MADINVLIQRRNSINAKLASLQAKRSGQLKQIESADAEVASLRAQRSRQRAGGDEQGAQFITGLIEQAEAKQDALNAQLSQTGAEIFALEQELAEVNRQISNLSTRARGEVSVGTTVPEAQIARDDQASAQAPPSSAEVLTPEGRIQTQPTTSTPSNAAGRLQPQDSGTDAPVKSAEQLQSTPPAMAQTPIQPGSPSNQVTVPVPATLIRSVPAGATEAGTGSAPVNPPNPVPTVNRGAAAAGDDNSNGVVARINSIFGGDAARVVPKGNVLDRFANYTYNISIYLTTSGEYRGISSGQRPSLLGTNLLMQSGGAPIGQRNQEFPLDFYIDNLSIRSVISGKGTGGAHNTLDLNFTVFEPYGVTFLERLAQASKKFANTAQGQSPQRDNYAAQSYLMVIKFWGYDENGELARVDGGSVSPTTGLEPGAVVEKYIPFRFTAIKFRLANRIAEYNCECVALRDYAPMSQTRGIIPYNIELTAVSLQQLLGVNLSFGSTNRQRDTQGRESVQGPLTPATQQNLAGSVGSSSGSGTNATFENQVGGEFASYFDGGAAGSLDTLPGAASSTALPGQSSAPPKITAAPRPNLVTGLAAALNEFQAELVRNKTYTLPDVYEIIINESILREATLQPAEAAAGLRSVPMTSAQTAGAQKLGIKQNVDRDNKNVAATAGMSVVQFLDQIVRNSSYIQDQQTKIYRKDPSGGYSVETRATGGQTFAWYRIGMDAVPIRSKGIDPKRGDYSYRITYTITPYQVNDSQSSWFPNAKFNGTHKKYDYWFTGLNTSIISYEQDYNYLYYIAVNGGSGVPPATSDYREYTQYAFQARAPEASQGAAGPVFDPPAQAAGALYSPGDTSQIKMQIMGDPAWIQQGEIVSGVQELGQLNYAPFLPDGTINFDSREILFEVGFNLAGDYNLDTGLMDVKRRSV